MEIYLLVIHALALWGLRSLWLDWRAAAIAHGRVARRAIDEARESRLGLAAASESFRSRRRGRRVTARLDAPADPLDDLRRFDAEYRESRDGRGPGRRRIYPWDGRRS